MIGFLPAKILIRHETCGDGCCFWDAVEIHHASLDGGMVDGFVTRDEAIAFCNRRRLDYTIEHKALGDDRDD